MPLHTPLHSSTPSSTIAIRCSRRQSRTQRDETLHCLSTSALTTSPLELCRHAPRELYFHKAVWVLPPPFTSDQSGDTHNNLITSSMSHLAKSSEDTIYSICRSHFCHGDYLQEEKSKSGLGVKNGSLCQGILWRSTKGL